jgi:protein-S-isoprenylcysteine O-methyltransferase Ste14
MTFLAEDGTHMRTLRGVLLAILAAQVAVFGFYMHRRRTSAVLLENRAALEDRTLQAELPGYAEYARRVRYRLLPGVW